jgi:hypothetical protein
MAELPPLLHVWWIVPVEVIATGFKAIVEALALNIPEFLWRRIPAAVFMLRGRAVLDHWHRMSLHSFAEVREGRVVAAAEAFAVCVAVGWRNLGMPELPPPLHVWWIVTVKVVPGSFEAIMESLALNIPELLWGASQPPRSWLGGGQFWAMSRAGVPSERAIAASARRVSFIDAFLHAFRLLVSRYLFVESSTNTALNILMEGAGPKFARSCYGCVCEWAECAGLHY